MRFRIGEIDGAGDFRIFVQLILPLAKPVIATIGLFTALTYWNDWYNSMLFITDENLYSLTVPCCISWLEVPRNAQELWMKRE